MEILKTIKVKAQTVKNLNKIAAENDEKQYEVVDRLAEKELSHIETKKKQSKK
jgi:hypothetical protein